MKKNKKKQIVFFCATTPYVMIYKIAREFKKRGYETILATFSHNDTWEIEWYQDGFDKILRSNFQLQKPTFKNVLNMLKKVPSLLKFIIEMKKLKPYVWFGVGRPNWPVMFVYKGVFKKFPFIFFEYDINSHLYCSRTEAKNIGFQKDFEINSEKYCFEHADGVLHKGAQNELNYVSGRIFKRIAFPKLVLNFLPPCSKEFVCDRGKDKLSKLDKEVHLVFIGGLFSDKSSVNYTKYLIKELLQQKMHLHIYSKIQHLSNKISYGEIEENYFEFLKNPYFHIHPALGPKELIPEINHYDFGIWIVEEYGNRKGIEVENGTGNKFTSYFEAGIPCIHDEKAVFMINYLSKFGKQLTFNRENISSLKRRISEQDYSLLVSQVKKIREKSYIENNFDILEEFLEEIAKKNKQKKG